jgi:hypothetical protein
MLILSFALLALLSPAASAVTLEVIGPCSEKPAHRLEATKKRPLLN